MLKKLGKKKGFHGRKIAVAYVAMFMLLFILITQTTPAFSRIILKRGGESVGTQVPLSLSATTDPLIFSADLFLLPLQSTVLNVTADDCIESVQINGSSLPLAPCSAQVPKETQSFDLGASLRIGHNSVTIAVVDTLGGDQSIDVGSSLSHGLLGVIRALLLACVALLALTITRRIAGAGLAISLIPSAAILVRILYGITTRYDVRTHDLSGHIEYFVYMATHWRLPPGSGYEYHQAPLAYILGGLIMKAGHALGWTNGTSLEWIQETSIALSVFTVPAIVWIGTLCLTARKKAWLLPAFLLIALFVPRMIMMSSQISNDPLVLLLMLLSLGLLATWWKKPATRTWGAIGISLGVGITAKLTAVLLLPVAFCCLVFKRSVTLRKKIRLGVLLILLLSLTTGWLVIGRLSQSSVDRRNILTFGHVWGGVDGLRIDRDPLRFLTFNPVGIIEQPFNDPWDDSTRRRYFLEYLYRSSIYGEFRFEHFRAVTPVHLLLGMLLLVLALCGLVRWCIPGKGLSPLPVRLGAACIAAGSIGYAVLFPFASEQDFRFSPLLGVFVALLIAECLSVLPLQWRRLGLLLVLGFAGMNCLFFLTLAVG